MISSIFITLCIMCLFKFSFILSFKSIINSVYTNIKLLTSNLNDQKFKDNFNLLNCKNFVRAWILFQSANIHYNHFKEIIISNLNFENCCNYLNNLCKICGQQHVLYEVSYEKIVSQIYEHKFFFLVGFSDLLQLQNLY